MEPEEQSITLKGYSRKRVISDMIGGAKQAAVEQNKPCREFILVIENETLKVINSLIKMTDLTSNGVFGVEKIELKRKPFPSFQAIYFITPTIENFDYID